MFDLDTDEAARLALLQRSVETLVQNVQGDMQLLMGAGMTLIVSSILNVLRPGGEGGSLNPEERGFADDVLIWLVRELRQAVVDFPHGSKTMVRVGGRGGLH